MPRSQTALCLLASMDPLVLSRLSRALLALVQSLAKSINVLVLLLPEVTAVGDVGRDIFKGGFPLINAGLG